MIYFVLIICVICIVYIIKKEYIENATLDITDNTSPGQKYSTKNVFELVNLLLSTFENPHSCLSVTSVKREGANIKMRLFIQNNKTSVVLEYELLGKLPLKKNGKYEIVSFEIVNADQNDLNGSNIKNGMYQKLKK